MQATLRPERMVHGGYALARDADGRVVLIEGALPGETVEVDVARRAGVAVARVTSVLDASPDRIDAPAHPGLDLGFVSYPRQLALGAEVLRDAAHRSGVVLPDEAVAVTPSPRTWGYRNVVQPALRGGRLGYRLPHSDDVRLLDEDPTATSAVRAAWDRVVSVGLPPSVAEVVLRGNDDGEVLAALVTRAPPRRLVGAAHRLVDAGLAGVAAAGWDARGRFRAGKSRLAGARAIRQRYGRLTLTLSATAFAQPNPAAAGLMLEALEEMASGGGVAYELFAGSGAIALHLAARYREVMAIEIASEGVARGRADAARLDMDHVHFVRADARRADLSRVDTLVVDPPRAGLAKPLRAAIDASTGRELLYVSCDAATWARDAADFTARGWRLTEVRAFDFQPHTHHLELATRFER